jgi:hypothetical protein
MKTICGWYVYHWKRAFRWEDSGISEYTAHNIVLSFISLVTIMLFHKVVILSAFALFVLGFYLVMGHL